MLALVISLSVSLSACFAAPVVTEDQLQSLIKPLLDSPTGSPKIPIDAPPLFASLAAVSPLDPHAIDKLIKEQVSIAARADQSSPEKQQLAQLNLPVDIAGGLAGGLTKLIKAVVGSIKPKPQTTPAPAIDPIFGTNTGSGTDIFFPNNIPINTYPNTFPTYPNKYPTYPNKYPTYPNKYPSFPNSYPFPSGVYGPATQGPTTPGSGGYFPTDIFTNTYPLPATPNNKKRNSNPLGGLFPGLGGGNGGPFGMMMPGLMMKAMTELF